MRDALAATAYWTNHNLPDFVYPHGPLIHASGSSAYEIFCSLFFDELLALLVEETNRYYDTMTGLLLQVTLITFHQNWPLVSKPIQLKQTISPKTAKTAQKCFKENYKPTMYFVLCILCCALCIVCCVSQYCVVSTIKCKFCQQKFNLLS